MKTKNPRRTSPDNPTPRARRSAIAALLIGCAVGACLSGCERRVTPTREWQASDHGQPEQADPARTPTPAAPEEGGPERAADALYGVSCAGCHGRDGRGQGPERPPGAQPQDFTSAEFQASRTDAQLRAVIQNGKGLMPAFGKKLNEQALDALVGRVRRFKP
jgi:mono/diheme cytochrome c family protein